uniref:Uncharacterized protein n=1 Tax=Eptatretus burgeri TaxID=7764 RepID=A0A8C4R710_EPTBU
MSGGIGLPTQVEHLQVAGRWFKPRPSYTNNLKSGFDVVDHKTSGTGVHDFSNKYKMTANPRGHCLIINNENFQVGLLNRPGSSVDTKDLEDFFSNNLLFSVIVKNDLTAKVSLCVCTGFSLSPPDKAEQIICTGPRLPDYFHNLESLLCVNLLCDNRPKGHIVAIEMRLAINLGRSVLIKFLVLSVLAFFCFFSTSHYCCTACTAWRLHLHPDFWGGFCIMEYVTAAVAPTGKTVLCSSFLISLQEIMNELKELAAKDHSKADCCIVFIMSHGKEVTHKRFPGAVLGVDDQMVRVENLLVPFIGDNCPSLTEKPKLFFIQACGGTDRDIGVAVKEDATDGRPVTFSNDDDNTRGSLDMVEDAGGKGEPQVDASILLQYDEPDATLSVPQMADLLVAYSTTPGYVSYRQPKEGSWYVQALLRVLASDADKEDLLSMLIKVNETLSADYQSKSKYKQISSPFMTLRKKLFFHL